MEELTNKAESFNHFTVERVSNGFILRLDDRMNGCIHKENVYVFNTLFQLSQFIGKLDD